MRGAFPGQQPLHVLKGVEPAGAQARGLAGKGNQGIELADPTPVGVGNTNPKRQRGSDFSASEAWTALADASG
jgi:hypothetical protein